MLRILSFLVALVLVNVGTAYAEQTDTISKRCEKETCYPCCMAANGQSSDSEYATVPTAAPTTNSAGEAVKANQ